MARKKRDLTSWIEAGKENLRRWKEENPEAAVAANFKHGAYSNIVRKKYNDARTREGKALKTQIDGLVADLEPLTPAQKFIIGRVAEKLIVLWQLSQFIETQGEKIIDERGSAIPCLSTNLRYTASLLRDLDLLYKKI
jgi:hypothetical protein